MVDIKVSRRNVYCKGVELKVGVNTVDKDDAEKLLRKPFVEAVEPESESVEAVEPEPDKPKRRGRKPKSE